MKKRMMLIMGLIGLLLSTQIIAEDITIKFEGYITKTIDTEQYFGDQISAGSKFSGFYTYSTNALDVYSDPSWGGYYFSTTPYGATVNINGIPFTIDPLNRVFSVEIINSSFDQYVVHNHKMEQLLNGVDVGEMLWHITYSSNLVFSDDLLPTTAPSLDNWTANEFEISGTCDYNYRILGTVTSVVIPEPATCIMMILGGTFIIKKRSLCSK